MSYPFTRTGYNIYDMMSLMQKGIRRGRFNEAGFAACQLKEEYRQMMWNRLFVISSEDCFGVITKELIDQYKKDYNDDSTIERVIAMMCKSRKSRDACYFSCNFVLSIRKPRDIEVSEEEVEELKEQIGLLGGFDESGFKQMSIFYNDEYDEEAYENGARLKKAINHLDMDMAGWYVNMYRNADREFLWKVLIASAPDFLRDEIRALEKADSIVNAKKKEKDEIFISKACILDIYASDDSYDEITSSDLVRYDEYIDWKHYQIKKLIDCKLKDGVIPEWVYDCHTLKGKKAGKTDWDMTVTEQAALFPLMDDYFSEASWIYIYEDDYKNGVENDKTMAPIREFAKTHSANPVEFIPYE